MSEFQYETFDRMDYDRPNECRADWGEQAVANGCDAEAEKVGSDPEIIHQDLSDALANIYHYTVRAGVDWGALVAHAEQSAEGDLEDGPEAARDTDRFPEGE